MPIFSLPDLSPALPEMALACAAMALLLVGVFRGEGSTRLVSWLSVAVLIVVLVLTGMFGMRSPGRLLRDVRYRFASRVFMKALVLIGSAVSIILALHYNEEHKIARFEFPVLVLLATTGMMVMVSANDLITLYLGIELQSLALYVVASFDRDSVRSTEAGLKYFVLGALASGLLLYGASLIYGFAGTTSFAGLAKLFAGATPPSSGLIIGLVLVAIGLAFKVSAVPFHMWTPDVYEGAPTPVTAFFSVAPKIAAVALFVRFLVEPFGGLVVEWRQVIVFLSVASMVLGAVAAIAQTNIKRLMAYSSIGHVGYALIGLAAASPAGIRGVLVYMAIYLFMNLGTWAVILCMRRQGQMLEEHRRSIRARPHPAGLGAGARHLHVCAGRHSADRRVLRQALHLPRGDRRAPRRPRGDRRRDQRRGRVLLSAYRQGDVFRRADRRVRPAARPRIESGVR